jgi:ribosomal protein S1
MDIDFEKEILDLSERLAETKPAPAQVKVGHQYRVTVELNKEDYLLVSFKQSKTCIGLLMMQSFNDDHLPSPNEKHQIGDEIEVRVIQNTETGYVLTVPVAGSQQAKPKIKSSSSKQELSSLVVGQTVIGVVKSLKGHCAFLQLNNFQQLAIGRLHRLEA